METIIPKITSKLSNMWTKVLNLENCLFPELKEQLGTLSTKEEKLIRILDFAQIEKKLHTPNIYSKLNLNLRVTCKFNHYQIDNF